MITIVAIGCNNSSGIYLYMIIYGYIVYQYIMYIYKWIVSQCISYIYDMNYIYETCISMVILRTQLPNCWTFGSRQPLWPPSAGERRWELLPLKSYQNPIGKSPIY